MNRNVGCMSPSQYFSEHSLQYQPSEEATSGVAKQRNRRYNTRSIPYEKESIGQRGRGGYVKQLVERHAINREQVFSPPTQRKVLKSSLTEGLNKGLNEGYPDIFPRPLVKNISINTVEEDETIVSADSNESMTEKSSKITSMSEEEVGCGVQTSPGVDTKVSFEMQLLGLEYRNGKLIRSSIGMSSDSVNLPVSDEVERKEDGRRESVIGPKNTRPEGLDGGKKFGLMSLLGNVGNVGTGKLHSAPQEVTVPNINSQCIETIFVCPNVVTLTDRSVHPEPKPITSWPASKVDIPQAAVSASEKEHHGSGKPFVSQGFSVCGRSDTNIGSFQLSPQPLSTPVATLGMFSPKRTAEGFPPIEGGELLKLAVVSGSSVIGVQNPTTTGIPVSATTDVHVSADSSTYFGNQVVNNRGGQPASMQLSYQFQQHLRLPPPLRYMGGWPAPIQQSLQTPVGPPGSMPPLRRLLQRRTESTPCAVLHAPGVLSSPSMCPPSSGSIPLQFTSLPESASVGAVLSGNEHAKFGDLVSDIISLLDDVPNKTACSTAVGQTGREQGVVNLAGEPGPEADHLLGREQGTSDVCEEQRKMSMGSDLHGKNHSIDADDVSGLKFEGCSSSVRPMKETQSIPVCLDEVERANTDGVKTAFPPAVSEPEQVKPVEVVGEGGVTMAAEEGGKGSEGLDHLSMVEEVDVALVSPLVCEGSVDMEEDVEWGGSGGDLRLHKERCLVEGEKAGVSGDIGGKARAAEGVNEECACVEKVEDENVSVD